MKKLMKVLVLVTVLAMMFAGLQVAALADEEGEEEEAPEAATETAEEEEEAPAESAAAATGNPETGATTPFAVASFGAILLAAGAVPVVMKKK